MPSLQPAALLAMLVLLTAAHDGIAAPDITMSIHSDLAGSGTPSSFTVNQVYALISNIEFRLRDLSNTLRRDQQMERINSRIDIMFNKLSHLEVSNEMWFDKFQQSVMEECGPNHMTRRLDKAQQQLEITLEHMETNLQSVQNHQKELEKEIKKVADRQTEMATDIQTMRKDMSSEFEKHNSNQITFRKQLQDTVANLSQQPKITDRSMSACSCNQDGDFSQIPETTTINKLATAISNMYNGLKDRTDHISISLKELVENTDKYRRRLDSDRRGVINEFLDSFLEAAIDKITAIQKKSENELEVKFKEHLQLLVDGQNLFMDNCHRLQSNERQIENDMVDILERILDRIDNKSKSEGTTLEQIPKTLKTQSSLEEKMFAELSELVKTQSDQLTRTVAYSTNQVLKLHQDVTNISNALMAVNNHGGLCNFTASTTDMNDRLPLHNTNNSHSSNPSTLKNKYNIEKPTTMMPNQNRSPHD